MPLQLVQSIHCDVGDNAGIHGLSVWNLAPGPKRDDLLERRKHYETSISHCTDIDPIGRLHALCYEGIRCSTL